jgi:hypothetical protein
VRPPLLVIMAAAFFMIGSQSGFVKSVTEFPLLTIDFPPGTIEYRAFPVAILSLMRFLCDKNTFSFGL